MPILRIFKTRAFTKWATKQGLADSTLSTTVDHMEHGLVDAMLGGNVVKMRVALADKGKSGGVRTILVYQARSKVFFVYGFAKNVKSNISKDELRALKHLAKELLGYTDKALAEAIEHGALSELKHDE